MTYRNIDIIALIALITSIISLLWNIIRDLVLDKVKIYINARAGGLLPIQGVNNKGFFRDADSEYTPKNPRICFTVTNTGRRPVLILKIWGKYSKKSELFGKKYPQFVVNTIDLPKMINPYETLSEFCDDLSFMSDLKSGLVLGIYVRDSKGKDWLMTKKEMKNLLKTIERLNLAVNS